MVFFKRNKAAADSAAGSTKLMQIQQREREMKEAEESKPSMPSNAQPVKTVNDFVTEVKLRQQQGLKPTGPELVAFARYLGIDPVGQNDLVWIAEEALLAPLPQEWTEHFDSSDRVFYFNNVDQSSSWTHPLENMYRETYKTIVAFRNSNYPLQEMKEMLEKLKKDVEVLEREAREEVTHWDSHVDNFGNSFFYNKKTQRSTWADPRPALCHNLYIRVKMIAVLCQHAGVPPLSLRTLDVSCRNGELPASPLITRDIRETRRHHDHGSGNSGGDKLAPLKQNGDVTLIAEEEDEGDPQEGDGKRKKKKKKRKDGALLHSSHSEPAGSFLFPPPPDVEVARGCSKGIHPPGAGTDIKEVRASSQGPPQSGRSFPAAPEGVGRPNGQSGRVRGKAGIRLAPLKPSNSNNEDGMTLSTSASVPSLHGFPDRNSLGLREIEVLN